ncbi:putative Zn-dependent peptidase [Anseongella ginsenosidimutans]|uniref:Putative Zn-dependent peptidase n=1 Tax=Anseongella ginsenosidimutans TaxID=496056 RepID=A0A4R3KNG2_9SPHI|nr:putative Zn-dependent peptidase [Anseongella ginsenosidimutans]
MDNGLKVLVHEDPATPMAVLNILYNVGARDEDPERTGFAHLFEHLMFGGSVNIPAYDEPLQRVGGENNAFTTNDITNYYIQVPALNLETAFWLESDRMLSLAFSEKSLHVQRNVVIEEFKQRYLNQPYGDVWLQLRPLAYRQHPYRWATIGKEISHISDASMPDVKAFFKKYYQPSNAILVVAGDVRLAQVKAMAEKWFGPISSCGLSARELPAEPRQAEARSKTVRADVPVSAIYKTWHMSGRNDARFYTADLISDVLSRGTSSRLYQKLVKEKQLFSDINAYVMGSMDPGLFVVEGKLIKGTSMEAAEEAIAAELELLAREEVPEREFIKVKNKIESTLVFSEMNLLDKAMNLAFFELLGDAGEYNNEMRKYAAVTREAIREEAAELFRPENSSTLYYLAN